MSFVSAKLFFFFFLRRKLQILSREGFGTPSIPAVTGLCEGLGSTGLENWLHREHDPAFSTALYFHSASLFVIF